MDAQLSSTDAQLVQEGDIAADYLEEFLDIADLDGDLDVDVRDGRAYIEISHEGASSLDAISGNTEVQALQELTRLAVQRQTVGLSRLILDINGSRQRRIDELTDYVDDAATRVLAGADRVELPAMSSYERKVVHDLVLEKGMHSESEGEGRNRHVVVSRISAD